MGQSGVEKRREGAHCQGNTVNGVVRWERRGGGGGGHRGHGPATLQKAEVDSGNKLRIPSTDFNNSVKMFSTTSALLKECRSFSHSSVPLSGRASPGPSCSSWEVGNMTYSCWGFAIPRVDPLALTCRLEMQVPAIPPIRRFGQWPV